LKIILKRRERTVKYTPVFLCFSGLFERNKGNLPKREKFRGIPGYKQYY
jgi:hypothetical protein